MIGLRRLITNYCPRFSFIHTKTLSYNEASYAEQSNPSVLPIILQLLNRNARRPKKANHGKRPCCHYGRRKKRLGKK